MTEDSVHQCRCGTALEANRRVCDACQLERKRQYARERMARLRADPILSMEIKAKDRERLEKWREAHPEVVAAIHKENRRIHDVRREQRKRQLPATLTRQQWHEIVQKFDGHCAYCGQEAEMLEKEHFVPIAKGGGFTKNNIVPSCPICNGQKRDQQPLDWLVSKEHGLVKYVQLAQYLEGA